MKNLRQRTLTEFNRFEKYAARLKSAVTVSTPDGDFTLAAGSVHLIAKYPRKGPITVQFLSDQIPHAMLADLNDDEITLVQKSEPDYPEFLINWHGESKPIGRGGVRPDAGRPTIDNQKRERLVLYTTPDEREQLLTLLQSLRTPSE